MNWAAVGQCTPARQSISRDDRDGVRALYGPRVGFVCNNQLDPDDPTNTPIGLVPATLRCVATGDVALTTSLLWRWGDGATSTGLEAEHTYTEAGSYAVALEATGETEVCGEWTSATRRHGFALVCDAPEPAFEARHISGLKWQLRNETHIPYYGCIQDIQWDVFRDGELVRSVAAWEPQVSFETEGTYRVVLNLGGPGGTRAAEKWMDVRSRHARIGCNTLMGGVSLGWLVVPIWLRRRRG
jgi:hypothetical protein